MIEGGESVLSPSLEDYLEEIYRLALSSQTVRVTDISHKLSVSLPSVNKAVHKLKVQAYVDYERYGEITLTDKGKELGYFLVQRNQLLQKFLNMICSNCQVAAEAEAMEHYLSEPTILAIQSLVHFLQRSPECYRRFLDFRQAVDQDIPTE